MNEPEIVTFTRIKEMDEGNRRRFMDFKEFNDFLNHNPVLTYRDVYNSYVKIILDIGKTTNFEDYSVLDFKVMKLIHEVKVPLNRVIDFARFKYGKIPFLVKNIKVHFF